MKGVTPEALHDRQIHSRLHRLCSRPLTPASHPVSLGLILPVTIWEEVASNAGRDVNTLRF